MYLCIINPYAEEFWSPTVDNSLGLKFDIQSSVKFLSATFKKYNCWISGWFLIETSMPDWSDLTEKCTVEPQSYEHHTPHLELEEHGQAAAETKKQQQQI